MRGVKKRYFLSLCLIFLAAVIIFSGTANATAALSITPSTQTVSNYSSSQAIVKVSISSVNNLFGYQYDISYNSNALTFVSTTDEVFLKSDGATTFCVTPNTSTAGQIKNIACTRQQTSTGVSGSGDLTKITFNIKQGAVLPATSSITISNVKLSDPTTGVISNTASVGTINIKVCIDGELKPCSINNCDGQQTCSSNQWGTCSAQPATTYYRDLDSDTYGNLTNTQQACSVPTGYVLTNTDCDDNNAAIHPGATEVCNNKDDDCDGTVDEGVKTTFYKDLDGDTYGNASSGTTQACTQPSGFVSNNQDCNDTSASIKPGATEICWNSIDEDCNGADLDCLGDISNGPDGSSANKIDIYDLVAVAQDFGKISDFNNPNSDINGAGGVDIYDLVIVAKNFGKSKP